MGICGVNTHTVSTLDGNETPKTKVCHAKVMCHVAISLMLECIPRHCNLFALLDQKLLN